MRLLAAVLALAACGDISRIDPAAPPPPPVTATGTSGAVAPLSEAQRFAVQNQLDRLDRLETQITRQPPTGAVATSDVEELRRQRQHAQAVAASLPSARPEFWRYGAAPEFTMPDTAAGDAARAIQRATTIEAQGWSHTTSP